MDETRTAPGLTSETIASLLDPLTELVIRAGEAILAVRSGDLCVADKADGSPVTAADYAADQIIVAGLSVLAPDIPFVSEERAKASTPPYRDAFFLIDPLDGTKEFIAGRDEFTVNIALVVEGVPVLGVIGAPAADLLWRGLVGRGAERLTHRDGQWAIDRIRTRPLPSPGEPWVAGVSRSHGDARSEAFIDARAGARRRMLGSALKFGYLADGTVDIYPRLAPTAEWDVAAGVAVVTAAGGRVTDPDGAPLRFGQGATGDFIVPGFIAWGDPAAARGTT